MKKLTIPLLEAAIVIIALVLVLLSQDKQHLLLQWFSLGLLWAWALWRLRSPVLYYGLIRDKVFLAYLLFVAWAIFSSFFLSSIKAISIIMLMPFIGGLLSYFIGYTSNKKSTLYFDRLLLFIGLILVAYTYYQAFVLDSARPTGVFRNWNAHAAFLAMIYVPWLLRYSLNPTLNVFQRYSGCAVSLLFAFAMSLTLSRGALLFFIVAAVCLLIIVWRQGISFKNTAYFFLAILLGYLFSGLFITDTIVQRLGTATQADSLAALGSGRHLLWLPAWQMYLDSPIFGWGLGAFKVLYGQYKDPLSNEAGFFVHNDYFEFLLELGFVGALAFIIMLGLLIKRLALLSFKTAPQFSTNKVEAFALLVTCMGMLAHTFFTFHMYHLTLQIIWGYYLGRSAKLLAVDERHIAVPKISQAFIWAYRIFCGVVILFMISFGLAFYYLDQGEKLENKQASLDAYWHAELFFPALERYNALSAAQLYTYLSELPNNADTSSQRQQLAALALSQVDIAIEKMPFNNMNYVTKARILRQVQGDMAVVNSLYLKALKVDPYTLPIRDEYAQYLIANRQAQQALSILWGGWERLNLERYHNGVIFLSHHLEVNKQYGLPEDSVIIEQEIQRLTELEKLEKGGFYVFHRL